MSQDVLVRIGIAGHANTGKTTLIRTLLRSPVGKVQDRAGATTHSSDYRLQEHQGLQAIFVDTPGFTKADLFKGFLALKKQNPSLELPKEFNQGQFQLDERAFEALKGVDAVLYVASLEVVPDSSHSSELELIRIANTRIVGVLNKGRATVKMLHEGKKALDARIELWQELFSSEGIKEHIVYDAFWEQPSKRVALYKKIETVIDSEKIELFRTGVAKSENRQQQIRSLACQKIVECVEMCYSFRETQKIESQYSSDHRGSSETIAKMEALEEVGKKTAGAIYKFYRDIGEIYEIAAMNPTLSAADVETRHYRINKRSVLEIIKNVGAGAGAGGAGAAAIGAAIGALVAGLLSGGLGAVGGATLGAQIGGIIGGALGAAGGAVTVENGYVHKVVLTDDTLHQIENHCIAAVWAMSHHGYGCSPIIEEKPINNLATLVESLNKRPFVRQQFSDAVKKCEQVLDKIESIEDYGVSVARLKTGENSPA